VLKWQINKRGKKNKVKKKRNQGINAEEKKASTKHTTQKKMQRKCKTDPQAVYLLGANWVSLNPTDQRYRYSYRPHLHLQLHRHPKGI
jgi:hypothetical protein